MGDGGRLAGPVRSKCKKVKSSGTVCRYGIAGRVTPALIKTAKESAISQKV